MFNVCVYAILDKLMRFTWSVCHCLWLIPLKVAGMFLEETPLSRTTNELHKNEGMKMMSKSRKVKEKDIYEYEG